MKPVLDRLIGSAPYALGSFVAIVGVRLITGDAPDEAVLGSLGSSAFGWGIMALLGIGMPVRPAANPAPSTR
ncbi:hypothetical protein HT102_14265 [Hoyosella sp. G463]|uniref:Uncharacterized protein n=1 Tax=Lolliginicoccus lacisalsi TaxID=2742202 RepID=A0A927PM75_9ACTN|nr:hypothetical protein [Lolliginicoccus lacisalsi]MBD8507648.1 hypothetical protein [Lolliginicoccus lacisalsi]